MNSPSSVSHADISKRARQIWQEAGEPSDSATAHWLQAERELHAQQGKAGDGDGARGMAAAPSAPSRHFPEKTPHSANYVHPGVTTDSLHHHRSH